MSEHLYHLTGYTSDGRRINRRYKTWRGADKMRRQMSWCNCSYLLPILLATFRETLTIKETP